MNKKIVAIILTLILILLFGCTTNETNLDTSNNSDWPPKLTGQNCQELNGNNCNEFETCSGEILPAIDTTTCCATSCLSGKINNEISEIEEPIITNNNAETNVDYNITFDKVTVRITGENYDNALLESITLFGEPPTIDKVIINNQSVNYDFNQEFTNAGYITGIYPFSNANIEIEYSYDPDDLGGNYCMGKACIIRLWNSYTSLNEFYYTIDSGDYNLFDFSLDPETIDPIFILTNEELYEEEGFILLKAQDKLLDDSEFNLYKLRTLANKTETFTGKLNKEATLFIVPGGLTTAYYFNDSSILLIPAYESNQANQTFVHEYSHFLLNDSYFPMWIQEGIAEYISRKVTNSSCGTWIDSGYDVLDWGVYEIPQDKIANMYGKVCSIFMKFDSEFGTEKTQELIGELEKLPDNDIYSEDYLDLVESKIQKVSEQEITIEDFIDKKYN